MKRLALTLVLVAMGIITTFARGIMTFSEAQQQAYFLTDKMAYELDLTPTQYDQVYQVNLEYFLNVDGVDPWGYYWNYRNTDLSYILFDWQYNLYRYAEYFYRPIQWRSRSWYLPIWDRYQRTYYYYDRPTIWNTWRGGLWTGRVHNTPSPFIGHRPHNHSGGMRHDPYPGGHPGHPGHYGGYDHDHNHGGQPGHHGGQPGYNGGNNHGNNHGGQPGYNGGNNRPGNNGGQPGYNGGNNRPGNGGGQPGGNGGARPGGNDRPAGGGAQPGGGHSGGSRGGAQTGGSRGGGSRGGNAGGNGGGRSFGGGRR